MLLELSNVEIRWMTSPSSWIPNHQLWVESTNIKRHPFSFNDQLKKLMEMDWTPWLNSQDPPPSEGHPRWHPCCFSRLSLPAGLSQRPLPRHHVQYLQAVQSPSPSCPNSTTVGQWQAPRLSTAEKSAKRVMPTYFWHHPFKFNSIYSTVLIAILNRDQRKNMHPTPPFLYPLFNSLNLAEEGTYRSKPSRSSASANAEPPGRLA